MGKEKFIILLSLSLLFILTGCGSPGFAPPAPSPTPSTIPMTTTNYVVQGDGTFLFQTNDTGNLGSNGKAFWKYSDTSYDYTTVSTVIDAKVKKSSGEADMGFGVLVAGTKTTVNSVVTYSFIGVLINNQKAYTIRRISSDGSETVLADWAPLTAYLLAYDWNEIKVTYSTSQSKYSVYFGTNPVSIDFSDPNTATSGNVGFLSNTGSNEVFPSIPCQVNFQPVNSSTGIPFSSN